MKIGVPDEILSLIFQDLPTRDLLQCQKTCASWYLAAHLLLLKHIVLLNRTDISRFIQCIEANPNPFYLKAIKRLDIGNPSIFHQTPLHQKEIKAFFSRFSHIQEIYIKDTLIPLKDLIITCSKITVNPTLLSLGSNLLHYHDLLYSLRHTLTSLSLIHDVCLARFGGPLAFITSFTHLQHLNVSRSTWFKNFEACLPLLPHLTSLQCRFTTPDPQVLTTPPPQRLKSLTLKKDGSLCPNSIHFITHHLINLTFLDISSDWNIEWTALQKTAVCTDLLGFAERLQAYRIQFLEMSMDVVKSCLPKTHHQLKLCMVNSIRSSVSISPFSILLEKETVTISCAYGAEQHLHELLKDTRIRALVFDVARVEQLYGVSFMYLLQQILDRSPNITRVELNMLFVKSDCEYPQVTHLVTRDESTLMDAVVMFPNLTHLQTSGSQIVLPHKKLDELGIKVIPQRNAYVVLEIEIAQKKQQLYKVSLNSLIIAKMDRDEKTWNRRVRIVLLDLKQLNICMNRDQDNIETKLVFE